LITADSNLILPFPEFFQNLLPSPPIFPGRFLLFEMSCLGLSPGFCRFCGSSGTSARKAVLCPNGAEHASPGQSEAGVPANVAPGTQALPQADLFGPFGAVPAFSGE
jgi:hypothetical protein